LREKVAIAGAFELTPGRFPELDAITLFRAVLKGAMSQWPVRPQDVDGLLTSPCGYASGPDTYVHDRLISELGIRPTYCRTTNIGGATYLQMVNDAAMAIRDGHASAVLCVSAGKFMKPGAGGGEMMARAISHHEFEVPYGTFVPALYGLSASQFMAERNVGPEDLARVAVSARKWALLNPHARMHRAGPLSIADVLASRMIATPFHYFDCSIPSDGGGAVLVTRAALAQKWTRQPAYIVGYGEYHGRGIISNPGSLIDTGASFSGPHAFREAGMIPRDIKAAQLYDAFSSTPLVLLENLGFCGHGEAGRFVQSGGIDPGGTLPANTYGGLMSFGHTGDASGMSLLTEGAKQTMGVAGPNQVADADRVLIHAYGGMMFDHTTLILAREA
jgi:acetyl-CoA acetyltransferase